MRPIRGRLETTEKVRFKSVAKVEKFVLILFKEKLVNYHKSRYYSPIASTAVCYETTEERKDSLKQMRACTNLNLTSNAHIETNTFS